MSGRAIAVAVLVTPTILHAQAQEPAQSEAPTADELCASEEPGTRRDPEAWNQRVGFVDTTPKERETSALQRPHFRYTPARINSASIGLGGGLTRARADGQAFQGPAVGVSMDGGFPSETPIDILVRLQFEYAGLSSVDNASDHAWKRLELSGHLGFEYIFAETLGAGAALLTDILLGAPPGWSKTPTRWGTGVVVSLPAPSLTAYFPVSGALHASYFFGDIVGDEEKNPVLLNPAMWQLTGRFGVNVGAYTAVSATVGHAWSGAAGGSTTPNWFDEWEASLWLSAVIRDL